MRAGYAIEYDAIVPTQLWPTLETKAIKTCILQVRLMEHQDMKKQGQGIMAGINAAGNVLGTGEKYQPFRRIYWCTYR